MGARLRVFLTGKQDDILRNLRTEDVPQKVKDRAEIIRLNAHGWYVEQIAAHFRCTPQTVREVLHQWQKQGVDGLWDKAGRGRNKKYQEDDIIFLEECLKQEPRTYNSLQLSQKLDRERHVKLSAESRKRLRVIVQDNGSIHQCQDVRQLWPKWQSQGLYLFFLPKYCSEMNPIELEWQHLKKDELSGQMFDDELDLSYGVINGIQARGERGNYYTERVKFYSNYHS
jgi:transposase